MRTCPRSCLVLLFVSFIGCGPARNAIEEQVGQHPHAFSKQVSKTEQINYLLYLPSEYQNDRRSWPLMVFLHGSGECGNDLELVKRNGPPKIVEEAKDFPFVLLSPQCPLGGWWSSETLNILLDEITNNYRIDRDRIYLTGLSMGGYATWSFAIEFPDKFAAIAPICGGGDANAVCSIRQLPVWVFHGAKDNVVPIESSEEMVTALRACGGNVRFTVYAEAGHNSWTAAYDNPELYKWFLSNHRSKNNGRDTSAGSK